MQPSAAPQIIKDLYRLNRNFCSSDYEKSLQYLSQLLPLTLRSFTADEPFNGWVVPPKWDLVKGEIYRGADKIFEVTHPLQIIGLSAPFSGTVTAEELKKHLHYDVRDPESTPYHFRQNYRPWERDWGFCVTKRFYDSIQSGEYRVEIVTRESKGDLKVAECKIEGTLPETFCFVAHLDHPGMANDDLAGVAVGVELFRRIGTLRTKFSYRLLLVQEMIGSVFYLGKLPDKREGILESLFLEMLGSGTPLALQKSESASSRMEVLLAKIMSQKKIPFRSGPFRSIICNDEAVWESYGIPMASLSRFPYPEYHSDKDNPTIIKDEALEETVSLLFDMVQSLEKSSLMTREFEGIVALSHPSYNLYVDPGQPAFGTIPPENIQRLRLLMDLVPIAPSPVFIETLAEQAGLSPEEALSYLQKWQEKGLVTIR